MSNSIIVYPISSMPYKSFVARLVWNGDSPWTITTILDEIGIEVSDSFVDRIVFFNGTGIFPDESKVFITVPSPTASNTIDQGLFITTLLYGADGGQLNFTNINQEYGTGGPGEVSLIEIRVYN